MKLFSGGSYQASSIRLRSNQVSGVALLGHPALQMCMLMASTLRKAWFDV